MKEREATSHKRSKTPATLTAHDSLLNSQYTPKSESVAKMRPAGGAHDASNGGTGIGPVDVSRLLPQVNQESVPARPTVVPTKAAIAAQVRGSRSNAENDVWTAGLCVAAAFIPTVYAKMRLLLVVLIIQSKRDVSERTELRISAAILTVRTMLHKAWKTIVRDLCTLLSCKRRALRMGDAGTEPATSAV
jgi:hypothetical protein